MSAHAHANFESKTAPAAPRYVARVKCRHIFFLKARLSFLVNYANISDKHNDAFSVRQERWLWRKIRKGEKGREEDVCKALGSMAVRPRI